MRSLLLASFIACANPPPAADTPDAAPPPPPPVDAATATDPGFDGPPFTLADPGCSGTDPITCPAVVYSVVGGTSLHLAIQAPAVATTQAVPAIVYLHPGGWSVGSYQQVTQLESAKWLAKGVAVISVEYRLTLDANKQVSGVTFPENLKDVNTAIQWLRVKAGAIVESDRIVVYGVSAGAHLGSLVAAAPEVAAFAGRGDPSVPSAVKAFVGVSTPINFHRFVPMNEPLDPSCPSQPPGQDPQQGVEWLIGATSLPATDPVYDTLSMLTYLSASTVPMQLTAGTCDQTVPYKGAAIDTVNEASAMGLTQIHVNISPMAFHATTLDDPDTKTAVDDFLTAQLTGN